MKKLNKIAAVVALGSIVSAPAFAQIDSDSAVVSMNVGLYAALTGLNDFVLTTSDTDGAAGATYTGSDEFQLESNGQVRVNLDGGNLSNGVDTVSTSYNLDGAGMTFDTTANSVHNAAHTVSAAAVLGEISAQQAGAYEGEITLTVSAI